MWGGGYGTQPSGFTDHVTTEIYIDIQDIYGRYTP